MRLSACITLGLYLSLGVIFHCIIPKAGSYVGTSEEGMYQLMYLTMLTQCLKRVERAAVIVYPTVIFMD